MVAFAAACVFQCATSNALRVVVCGGLVEVCCKHRALRMLGCGEVVEVCKFRCKSETQCDNVINVFVGFPH